MNDLARHPSNTDPLLPPREAPYVLRDVLEKTVYGCRDELILNLEDCCLRFGVDIDTDTITSRFQPVPFRAQKGFKSVQSSKPWQKCVGKECGWTWFAWNQQGYLDSVLISFNGIEPNVLLHTIGSAIEIFVVRLAEKGNGNMRALAENIRVLGENTVRTQLESAGFTVDAKTINRLRIVIAERPKGPHLGVLIRSRERRQGDDETRINAGKDDSVLAKFEQLCQSHELEPWLAFYVQKSGDIYMTSLNHYWSEYRGVGQIPVWKLETEDKNRYGQDAQVMHVNVSGSTAFPTNWF